MSIKAIIIILKAPKQYDLRWSCSVTENLYFWLLWALKSVTFLYWYLQLRAFLQQLSWLQSNTPASNAFHWHTKHSRINHHTFHFAAALIYCVTCTYYIPKESGRISYVFTHKQKKAIALASFVSYWAFLLKSSFSLLRNNSCMVNAAFPMRNCSFLMTLGYNLVTGFTSDVTRCSFGIKWNEVHVT